MCGMSGYSMLHSKMLLMLHSMLHTQRDGGEAEERDSLASIPNEVSSVRYSQPLRPLTARTLMPR